MNSVALERIPYAIEQGINSCEQRKQFVANRVWRCGRKQRVIALGEEVMPSKTRSRLEWRRRLRPGDEEVIQQWIAASSLAKVARIISILSDATGARGPAQRPDIALALNVARLLNDEPGRSLHFAAAAIAERAHNTRKPRIAIESLTRQLERDFNHNRHAYMMLVRGPAERDDHEPVEEGGVPAAWRDRILSRLIQCLPSAIDLYDSLLAEAKATNIEKAKLVRSLGRARVEELINEVLRRGTKTDSLDDGAPRATSLLQRLLPDLERMASEIRSARRLRRKSAK